MRCGWRWRAAQWANWTSSNSSMLAKCRFIRQRLVSGHRCSAGWSSGAYGGRKSKWTWSGTRSCTLVCPARPIEDEYDLLGGARSRLAGEFG
jgi:hypothetical protein